jgi:hypothetical protein
VPEEEIIPKKVEEDRRMKGKKNKKVRNTNYVFCLYILIEGCTNPWRDVAVATVL